jgi:hypothetical protein
MSVPYSARKLRERLLRKLPNHIRVPACSTIHAFIERHGLVARQRHSRTKTAGTPLSQGSAPNAFPSTIAPLWLPTAEGSAFSKRK